MCALWSGLSRFLPSQQLGKVTVTRQPPPHAALGKPGVSEPVQGAPPNGLMGATSGGAVGAHARHLDPTLLDRVGQVALCTDCHDVPETLDAPGHLDAEAPADPIGVDDF